MDLMPAIKILEEQRTQIDNHLDVLWTDWKDNLDPEKGGYLVDLMEFWVEKRKAHTTAISLMRQAYDHSISDMLDDMYEQAHA